MYKNSLVLGKFTPPHLGHFYLIDEAIRLSDSVHIMICWNKTQKIPPVWRHQSITNTYGSNTKVKIYLVDDTGLPQSESECETKEQFYSYWVPFVKNKVKDLDVVFTSEDYGDDFADFLGIKHHLVDKERLKFPVSGTNIRNNPTKYWEFIPDNLKSNFVKRIAIMGPESVGKSTLTKNLAQHYETNFLEEWGRVVYEQNGNHLEIDDFIKISKERSEKEEELLKHSNKLFFTDTEDITTYLFSKMFYPDEYFKIKYWFNYMLASFPKYDLYILLKPDCDAVQDGTRQFLEEREEHYQEIRKELIERKYEFIEIGGNWENRLLMSIEKINSSFINI
jgi:HTH-type transcriptional repressor of NAD biosynthesis genes